MVHVDTAVSGWHTLAHKREDEKPMSLVLKPTSKWWYARPLIGGGRKFINLGVAVAGVRPSSLRHLGDAAFEVSRLEAKRALEKVFESLGRGHDAEYHRRMYEILTGASLEVSSLPIEQLEESWLNVPGRRHRSDKYLLVSLPTIRAFVAFARGRGHLSVRDVSVATAQEFMRTIESGGASAGTFSRKLTLLRSVFRSVRFKAHLTQNVFEQVRLKDETTIHRRPLTEDELRAVLKHADPVMRGPMVTGICTAMRRADCCLLEWASVDEKAGFVKVRTGKTGETAEIPIFPLLAAELKGIKDRDEKYVWPKAALMQKSNPQGLTYRMIKAFERAGIVRTVEREDGLNRGSVADFHAFRTTWITMALSAGVPMELVRRVTGHSTVETVLKHYFRPGRDALKKEVAKAFGGALFKGRPERRP